MWCQAWQYPSCVVEHAGKRLAATWTQLDGVGCWTEGNIFYFHPYLGKISNLTNIFQLGWYHQSVICWYFPGVVRRCHYSDLILEPPCHEGPKRRAFFSKKQFQVQTSEPGTWNICFLQMIVFQLSMKCDSKSLPKNDVIPNLYINKMGCFHHLHPFFSTDEFQLPRGWHCQRVRQVRCGSVDQCPDGLWGQL